MPYKDPAQQRAAQRRHYVKNKVLWRQRSRTRREANKTWFRTEILPTLKCVRCGEDHPSCLDFHHRDPHQKDMSISEMIHELRNREWILDEISKCDVLCANCHRKVHWEMRLASRGQLRSVA